MVNEVDITGKAAQFGRGIITDVSKEIMGEFAENLRRTLITPETGPASAAGAAAAGTASSPHAARPVSAPIGVGALAGKVIMNRIRNPRVVSTLIEVAVILLLARRLRR
jgi:hypothetical protein